MLKLVATEMYHGFQIPPGVSGEGDCYDRCAVGRIKKKPHFVADRPTLHAAT